MFDRKRRDFITLLGGAAAAWPLGARAQQAAMPVVGFLGTTSPDDFADRVAAFREGLKQVGYVEGQNLVVEYRWPEGNYDRLPTLAADLVRRQVAVIAAVGGEPSPLAAMAATATIPIVFSLGTDPVRLGLVTSLNRPSGNITGVYFLQSELGAKRLGLLHELLPKSTVIGMLVNPKFGEAEFHAKEAQEAARSLGVQIHVVRASTVDEFDTAFLTLAQEKIGALVLANDALFTRERRRLIALAAQHAMPAVYFWREFAVDGGLMSYSPSLAQAYRHVGIYTGKILNGAKPADLPVVQPTKFEFVINLKTAKTLGITFPPGLLAIADEVIE
jgi:putative tryptophan/tyrosine transport system substrate-binding protein